MTRLLRWFTKEPELRIDPRRLNDETRAEHQREVHTSDLVYRARVKRRMLEGANCPLPPLIQKTKVQHGEVIFFHGSRGA